MPLFAETRSNIGNFFKLLYLAPLFWLLSIPHNHAERKAAKREARARHYQDAGPHEVHFPVSARAAQRVQVPNPLPPRQRRLSLPDSTTTAIDGYNGNKSNVDFIQRTQPQQQSPLFALLPVEIRLMIYNALLGQQVLHIVQKGRKFVHIRCRAAENGGRCLQHECWTYPGWDEGAWPDDGDRVGHLPPACDSLLMLARTCRRVYTESVPLIYESNTFSFNTLPNLLHFPLAILPTRLTTIRNLEFKWHFVWPFHQMVNVPSYLHSTIAPPGHDEATWSDAWRMILGMRGLRELRVTIMFNGCVVERGWEIRVLSPLMGLSIKRLNVFEIEVPWEPLGNDWSEAPFDIRYRGQRLVNENLVKSVESGALT